MSYEMPANHMVFRTGDQYHHFAAQPKTIDMHDVMNLVVSRCYRPEIPKARGHLPECSTGNPHLGLPIPGKQPFQEQLQLFYRFVVTLRGGRTARPTAPSLRP
jgi:hypothetical protein